LEQDPTELLNVENIMWTGSGRYNVEHLVVERPEPGRLDESLLARVTITAPVNGSTVREIGFRGTAAVKCLTQGESR